MNRFSGRRGRMIHNYQDTRNSQVSDTISSDNYSIINEERLDNLLSMIIKNHTTSVLNKLEEYRKNLSIAAFRSLLLLLTTKFNNSTWLNKVQQQNVRSYRQKSFEKSFIQYNSNKENLNKCILVIIYYIVSVIHKYKIIRIDEIWTQILNNSITQTISFYLFLYKNQIIIPDTICKVFSEKLQRLFSLESSTNKTKLILLGFTLKPNNFVSSRPCIRIKDCENLFSNLKHQPLLNKNIQLEYLLPLMTTPEYLSLFLSYFSDYELNTINPHTNKNILDQIINMKPYFYVILEYENNTNQVTHSFIQHIGIRKQNTDSLNLNSHPNDISKYRTSRLLNLFQSVILQGAQLSKPLFKNITNEILNEKLFFTTTIGIYALIGLDMDDIYPSESPEERDKNFILNIIQLLKQFSSQFQEFILHYLARSYSLIHKNQFMDQQRIHENIQTQKINDILFQQTLTLKEWCRLKIKDNCSQKNIKQLNLSKSLKNYCSFNFYNSNYASECIQTVIRYKGNHMPKHVNIIEYSQEIDDSENENIIGDENSYDNEYEFNSTISVYSFNQSDEGH